MGVAMHELRRLAYLEALGIDSYVSRTQLPGAALTRRLAIVTSALHTRRDIAPRPGPDPVTGMDTAVASPPLVTEPVQRGEAVPRFSLVAIVTGEWLWLEDLAGMPLTTEQVQLVQSMAQALVLNREPRTEAETSVVRPAMARPDVAQFDWPIHTNQQLDLGAEAARASVAGFVGRRLEQHGCRGLVLLGQSCAMRVPVEGLKTLTVSTASSAEILAQPTLKRTVWRDLLPLVSKR